MNIKKNDRYCLVSPSESSFSEFYKTFIQHSELSSEHVCINFLDAFDVSSQDVELFSEIALQKKEDGTSFVLIANTVDIDAFEDESLSIVPTIQEAEDVLAMDAMERDLGF